jgi:uncharacterized phage-associated protein
LEREVEIMAVNDVANYILTQLAPSGSGKSVTTWKLEKLVYYCQSWSLVWDELPLFDEEIQAWANGPVCPDLYNRHKGLFVVDSGSISGNPDVLTHDQKETIDSVLSHYGDKSGQWLRDLTHAEAPWLEARAGLPDGANSNAVITLDSMASYYSSL